MFHLLIFNIGGSEFFLIMLVILLFFGAKGIPDIARSLGKASREFKDAMSGIEKEIRDAANTDSPPPARPQQNQDTQKIEQPTVESKSEQHQRLD
jgi:sec-independent protein translocase protein TatA